MTDQDPEIDLNEADKKKHWIADATKNKGALHRALGVPEDEPIPVKKLRKAAAGDGVNARRAQLALTLRKMHK